MGCKANEYHYKEEQNEIAKSFGFDTPQDAMIKLYKSGKSFNDIGVMFGLRKETVGKRLKKLNVKSRGRGGANGKKITLTKRAYLEIVRKDKPQKELAKKYNLSVPSISRVQNGYKPIIVMGGL